jgi:hypothetical protein
MSQTPPGPFQPGFDLLTISLSAAVPLRIMKLIRDGGPSEADFERIKSYQEDLTTRGSDLYFRNTKNNATATRFNQVADAIAVMSFLPGGITTFGMHFDGNELKKRLEEVQQPSSGEGKDA